ncbi:MAG: SDR family NAD(P)-dependent oxidoreductase [Terriglobia bacterium]
MPDSGYALVTGASSGIGECFARALARRGQNLVLAARTKPKLDSLAAELRKQHSIAVEVVEIDLSAPGAADRLARILVERKLHVDVLINNAGFGAHERFWKLPLERQSQMIRLNVIALVELTHLLLPAMLERRRGAIINVSSTAGFQPVPNTAVYAATKAFVTSFSEALAWELRPQGIIVVTLCPGGTRTNFFQAGQYQRPSLPGGMQNSEEVVRAALDRLDRGGGLVIPGTMNKVALISQRFATRRMVTRISARIFRLD